MIDMWAARAFLFFSFLKKTKKQDRYVAFGGGSSIIQTTLAAWLLNHPTFFMTPTFTLRRFTLTFCFLWAVASGLLAQNPSKISIKGMLSDTLGEDIPFATVMLLNPTDSTLANFTRSDDKGAFAFKNVKNKPYLLKVTYVGYLPLQLRLDEATGDVDLGKVKLKPISTELMEVVIRTAKAPLRIKGDTIEYDATTFKVPPGSTVEDLLRRLPGIEVDAQGNIKAQGRDVERVYVDGKTFFGDDPTSATKNLGAETISRVQVYDEKSEQAKLTGVDDGKKEKAMNLELKEEYKKGAFGKITAGVGTEDRLVGRGNYNRFNPKMQLSFIGYANNINQTGVNWEDYGEFKGQNSFSDDDNGDFGFGGGRQYFYYGGDDDITNNFDGRGFTENYGGGSNFNFDNKKTKLNASYFYNQTALDLDEFGFRQTFLPDNSTFSNFDTTRNDNFRGNHTLSTRLEHNLDSSDVVIVRVNLRLGQAENLDALTQLFSPVGITPGRRLTLDNSEGLQSYRLNSSAIYRHRFKKPGRALALSAGLNDNQSDAEENLQSINRLFNAENFEQQVRLLNTRDNATRQYKSSALYTDAFAKKWFWESFVNWSQTQNDVNRQSTDPLRNERRVDSLSVFYDNDIDYQRVGSGLRYSHAGFNLSAGVAAQRIRLRGAYAIDRGLPNLATPIDRTYNNLTPHAELSWELPGNVWISSSYNYSVQAPEFSDLQPVPNVVNPAFRIEGNPNLSPERSHAVSLNLNRWNPANFSNIGIGVWGNRYDNNIVESQLIELVDSVGVRTTTRPINVDGGYDVSGYLWSNFPIIKTKLTMNVNGNIGLGKTPTYVNEVENINTRNSYGLRAGFNGTPTSKLIFGISANAEFQDVRYSIQSTQNQEIINYGLDLSVKWQVVSKVFFESNFDYSRYKNDRFGFDRDIPIWNASVRHIMGKRNRLEFRLAAFDLLNQRVNINQFGSQNFVSNSVAPTLARYVMLSASYNLRGYENKLNKNNWW
jgi:hypothetical protein